MKTRPWAVGVMLLTALANAFGLFSLKMASGSIDYSFAIFLNIWLYIGLSTMVFGAVLMILGFKGGKLSILYPLLATTYIWMTIFSHFFFNEEVSVVKWIGIGLIVGGVSIIGGVNGK